jgi:hypothetical protein
MKKKIHTNEKMSASNIDSEHNDLTGEVLPDQPCIKCGGLNGFEIKRKEIEALKR